MSDAPRADHLVGLHGGWTVWRWVCLRGAGFPVSLAGQLAAPHATAAADRVLGLERERVRAFGVAFERLTNELSSLNEEERRTAKSALKALARGSAPSHLVGSSTSVAALEGARAAAETLDRARSELRARFGEWTESERAALRGIASDPLFRNALLWQNRRALKTGVASLLRKPISATDFKTRQNEALVANYAQRYSLKNDTIGFFGPVGWGTFEDSGPALRFSAGPSLVRSREIFFEYWAMEALAATFARLPAIRRHLRPRLSPTVRFDKGTLHYPLGRVREPPLFVARLLAECDGDRTAQEIGEKLSSDPALGLTPADVFDCLEQLARRKIVLWELTLPPATPFPERALQRELSRLPDLAEKKEALSLFYRLLRARTRIGVARGDETELDRAFEDLETTFTEITGSLARRKEGETYAGRTLVYEECRRDVTLHVGPAVLDRLARPLSLVLGSARWYTSELARRYRALFLADYRVLCEETRSAKIDLVRFLSCAGARLSNTQNDGTPTVRAVVDELTSAWEVIFACPDGARRVERESRLLAAAVSARFRAPHPGWPTARFHSPDVLLAARDAAAIEAGDFMLVLGELHAGWNTFAPSVFLGQHDHPDELVRAVAVDVPFPRISQVEPRDGATRLFPALFGPSDVEFEMGPTRSLCPRVVPASSLVVEDTGDGLVVRSRDGTLAFDLVAFMERYLILDSMSHFRLVADRPHAPRISIDGLVVARESWRLTPEAFAFAQTEHVAERFLGARRLARDLGMPRHVFVKTNEEQKPFYVDFESATFVESFARACRRSSGATITEMLPSPEETWLVDAQGNTYTSELRIVARDPHSYPSLHHSRTALVSHHFAHSFLDPAEVSS